MRLLLVLLGLVLLDLLLLAGLPSARLWVDPLLLFLVFLGFAKRPSRAGARSGASDSASHRALWFWGLMLGLTKDLYSANLFGAWAASFVALAWLIGRIRQLVEWEDPAVVGVWMSILTLLAVLVHGAWLTAADPALSWTHGEFLSVPVAMVAQGLLAHWSFPMFQRFVSGRR